MRDGLEVAREVVMAWNTHDLDRWLGCWHVTCEWVPRLRGQVEGAQIYQGHEGLRRYWEEDEAVWDDFLMQPQDFRQMGDEVIAICTCTARGRESGAEITAPLALRLKVRDGKISLGQSYLDVEEALGSLGLQEKPGG
jgi:ketosteroid isomerase-like protein